MTAGVPSLPFSLKGHQEGGSRNRAGHVEWGWDRMEAGCRGGSGGVQKVPG